MTGEYRVIGHRAATVSEQAGRERPGTLAALLRAERAEAWAEGYTAGWRTGWTQASAAGDRDRLLGADTPNPYAEPEAPQ